MDVGARVGRAGYTPSYGRLFTAEEHSTLFAGLAVDGRARILLRADGTGCGRPRRVVGFMLYVTFFVAGAVQSGAYFHTLQTS